LTKLMNTPGTQTPENSNMFEVTEQIPHLGEYSLR